MRYVSVQRSNIYYIVKGIMSSGRLWLSLNIRLRKSVESLTNEGILLTKGLRKWSAYFDNLTVGPSHPEMIGLPGLPAL